MTAPSDSLRSHLDGLVWTRLHWVTCLIWDCHAQLYIVVVIYSTAIVLKIFLSFQPEQRSSARLELVICVFIYCVSVFISVPVIKYICF